MATCDYCGSTILFGGKADGTLRFCNDRCVWGGKAILNTQAIPEAVVENRLRTVHEGSCPRCGGPGPVDVHTWHSVWSALVLTSWKSMPQVCCRRCGLKSQLGGTAFSLLLGWWGFPFGLIMTPVQVTRNLVGIFAGPNPANPSPALEKIIRRRLGVHDVPAPPPGASHRVRSTLDGMEGRFQ